MATLQAVTASTGVIVSDSQAVRELYKIATNTPRRQYLRPRRTQHRPTTVRDILLPVEQFVNCS